MVIHIYCLLPSFILSAFPPYCLLPSSILSAFPPWLQACSLTRQPPCNLKLSGDLMAHNTTHPKGEHRPADGREEAVLLELPNQDDLSWVERGWLSALGVPLEDTPPTDPAGGELAVGLTGDMYYILPAGTPEKVDDTPGKQLLKFLMMPVPDEQDSVADTASSRDGKGNGDIASPLLGAHQEKELANLM